jgi:DNA-binding LacI/PurR family transcriptional regulator
VAEPDISANPRRFPPPWIAEETDACFIIRDHNGQALAYVYFEDEPGRRSAAHLLTRDEARRIAVNTAKLPELLASRESVTGAVAARASDNCGRSEEVLTRLSRCTK